MTKVLPCPPGPTVTSTLCPVCGHGIRSDDLQYVMKCDHCHGRAVSSVLRALPANHRACTACVSECQPAYPRALQ